MTVRGTPVARLDVDIPQGTALREYVKHGSGLRADVVSRQNRLDVLESVRDIITDPLKRVLPPDSTRVLIGIVPHTAHFLSMPIQAAWDSADEARSVLFEFYAAGDNARPRDHDPETGAGAGALKQVMFVGASGDHNINPAAECDLVERSLDGALATLRLLYAVTPTVATRTVSALRSPSIVHLAAHGGPEGILLENELGGQMTLPFGDLAEACAASGSVRLLVITTCNQLHGEVVQTALRQIDERAEVAHWSTVSESSLTRGLVDVAASLGVPVIGSAGPLDDSFAIVFSKSFYRYLVKQRLGLSESIHQAVADAFAECPWASDLTRPLLMWPNAEAKDQLTLMGSGAKRERVPPPTPVDPDSLSTLLHLVRERRGGSVVVVAPPGCGKTTLLEQAARQLRVEGAITQPLETAHAGEDTQRIQDGQLVRWPGASDVAESSWTLLTATTPAQVPSGAYCLVLRDLERATAQQMARTAPLLDQLARECLGEVVDYSFGVAAVLTTMTHDRAEWAEFFASHPTSGMMDMGDRWVAVRSRALGAIGPLEETSSWLDRQVSTLSQGAQRLLSLLLVQTHRFVKIKPMYDGFHDWICESAPEDFENSANELWLAGLLPTQLSADGPFLRLRTCVRDGILGNRLLESLTNAAMAYSRAILHALILNVDDDETREESLLRALAWLEMLNLDLDELTKILREIVRRWPSRGEDDLREVARGLLSRGVPEAAVADLIAGAGIPVRDTDPIFDAANRRDPAAIRRVLADGAHARDSASMRHWELFALLLEGKLNEVHAGLPRLWRISMGEVESEVNAALLALQLRWAMESADSKVTNDLDLGRIISVLRRHAHVSSSAFTALASLVPELVADEDLMDAILNDLDVAAQYHSDTFLVECALPEARARAALRQDLLEIASDQLRRALHYSYMGRSDQGRDRLLDLHLLAGGLIEDPIYRRHWGAVLKLGYGIAESGQASSERGAGAKYVGVYDTVAQLVSGEVYRLAGELLNVPLPSALSALGLDVAAVSSAVDGFRTAESPTSPHISTYWGSGPELPILMLARAIGGDAWATWLLDSYRAEAQLCRDVDGNSVVRAWDLYTGRLAQSPDGTALLQGALEKIENDELPALRTIIERVENWSVLRAEAVMAAAASGHVGALVVTVFGLLAPALGSQDGPQLLAAFRERITDGRVSVPNRPFIDQATTSLVALMAHPSNSPLRLEDVDRYSELRESAAKNFLGAIMSVSRPGEKHGDAILLLEELLGVSLGEKAVLLIRDDCSLAPVIAEVLGVDAADRISAACLSEAFLHGWIDCLGAAGLHRRAQRVARAGLTRFPDSVRLRTSLVVVAVREGDQPLAESLVSERLEDPREIQISAMAAMLRSPLEAADEFGRLAEFGGSWRVSGVSNRLRMLLAAEQVDVARAEFATITDGQPRDVVSAIEESLGDDVTRLR